MDNQRKDLDWINEDEPGLAEWLDRYMTKRGDIPSPGRIGRKGVIQLKRIIGSWPTEGPEAENTLKRLKQMSGAWTQQKIRNEKRKAKIKDYRFELTNGAQRNLLRLTKIGKFKSPSQCVEQLIQDGITMRYEFDHERKMYERMHQEELLHKQNQIKALGYFSGHVLTELSIFTLSVSEMVKNRSTPARLQDARTEEAYIEARKSALKRISHLTNASTGVITKLIKQPTREQVKISTENIRALLLKSAPDIQPIVSISPPLSSAETWATNAIGPGAHSKQATEEEPSPPLMPGDDYDNESPYKNPLSPNNLKFQNKKPTRLTHQDGVVSVITKDTSVPATEESDTKEVQHSPEASPSTDET